MDILQVKLNFNYKVCRTFQNEYIHLFCRKTFRGIKLREIWEWMINGTKRPQNKYRVGKTIKNDYRDAKKSIMNIGGHNSLKRIEIKKILKVQNTLKKT